MVVLWLFLPGGVRQAGVQTFWSLTRRVWIDVHLWTSLILTGLIVRHLLLHVSYIEHVPRLLRGR